MTIDLDDLARGAVAAAPTSTPDMGALRMRVKRRRRNRLIVAGALATPVIVLVSFTVWSQVDRGSSSTQVVVAGGDGEPTVTVDEEPGVTADAEAVALGGFVWPAPPRDFSDLDALTSGLIEEVLGWPPGRVRQDGGNDDFGPQSFTLVNLDTDRELHLLAVPSAQGWGFVQIGGAGTTIGESAAGGFAIEFPVPAGAASSIVEVRYLDGTIGSETTTRSEIPLPADRALLAVASVLITHLDGAGAVITISGGQFSGSTGGPPASAQEAPILVPDLVGLDVEEATDVLEEIGLGVAVVEAPSTGTSAGFVVALEPAPGTEIPAGTAVTITVADAPSQSDSDAARDQIVPAVAALPFDVRVHQIDELFGPTRVDTGEGTWIISQPLVDPDLTDDCSLGDPNGAYGLDRVCVNEYAEILLLARGTGEIVRAYPFAGLKPQSLQATSDAVYCIRQGDGALPDSMLCRIDLTTLDATVRVFPSALDSSFSPGLDRWTPSGWIVDEPTELVLWENLDATDSTVTINGWSGTATVDRDTLAILTVDESSPD